MRIFFLDCTPTAYNGDTAKKSPLGGIESTTVELAESFASLGHDTTVITQSNILEPKLINGVSWTNYKAHSLDSTALAPDVMIANNDATLFDCFSFPNADKQISTILWIHNPVSLWKTIRRKRFLPICRWRPIAVFVGELQKQTCSSFLPFKKRLQINHGLNSAFLSELSVNRSIPPKQAIFFSQAYRGFKDVAISWVENIHPVDSDAVLKAYIGLKALDGLDLPYTAEQLARANIQILEKVTKKDLIQDLSQTRLLLYPGHKDETFCLAAAEANALGVPIVSFGIGALSERVQDGVNGYIVDNNNYEALAIKSLDLLQDEELWLNMSQKSKQHVVGLNWDDIAKIWEEKALSHVQ